MFVLTQERSSKKVMLDIVCDALELLRMDKLLSYASMQALASGVAGMLFDLVCRSLTSVECMPARSAFANRSLTHQLSLQHLVQALPAALSPCAHDDAMACKEVTHLNTSFVYLDRVHLEMLILLTQEP